MIAEARLSNPGKFDSLKKAANISGETAVNGIKKFQDEYDNYNYLVNAVAALPQKNSIPSYVAASRAYVNSMGETFVDTTTALENEKKKLSKQVANLSSEVSGLEKDYDDLIDEYNDLIDEYDELNDSYEGEKAHFEAEKAALKVKFEAEKEELLKKNESEKTQLKNDFEKESEKNKNLYENAISGVITNSKAMAAVISASSKNDIMVYVTPEIKKLIGNAEVPAEIKAIKAVKGTIKADGEYFKFTPAKDKNGAIIDFDLATVTPGLIVKLTVKK